jgi:plastocyanin
MKVDDMKRQLFSLLLLACTVAALAGCGGGGGSDSASAPKTASSQSDTTISISDFKFVPQTLTMRHGAPVRVTNSDSAPHTVTADDGHSFDSGTVTTGKSATIRVAKAGRFPYHCTIHPFMKGVLVAEST